MEKKLLMQDLSVGLSQRSGIGKRESETFVRTFFAAITQYLQEDKIVKIKGMGTFKVVEVSGRDSINVNTGERIHIKGHSKVTFTPDATMRDIVNRPFADFETLILNEGVDIAAMEYVADSDKGEEVSVDENTDAVAVKEADANSYQSEESEVPETEAPEDVGDWNAARVAVIQEYHEPVEVQDSPIPPAEGEETSLESLSPVVQESLAETQELPDVQPKPSVVSAARHAAFSVQSPHERLHEFVSQPETASVPEPSVSKEQGEADEGKAEDNQNESLNPQTDNGKATANNGHCHMLFLFFKVLLVILLMVLSYLAGTSHLFECEKDDVRFCCADTLSEADTLSSAKPSISIEKDTIETVREDSLLLNNVEEEDTLPSCGVEVIESEPIESGKSYPQVRNGIYEIVGVKGFHTLQRGESVSIVARIYFSDPKLSVYVATLNELSNPDLVEEGQVLKIPMLRRK